MTRSQAMFDGVYTGFDPIGNVIGHLTGNKYFTGYFADVYSLEDPRSTLHQNWPAIEGGEDAYRNLEPVKRSGDDQFFKGVGDVLGLAANVSLFGLPQAVLLFYSAFRYYQDSRIKNHPEQSGVTC